MAYFLSYMQVSDSNGKPVAGATAQFFLTGTTTPLDTYSNAALSATNANPVVADDEGRFGLIELSDQIYKCVITIGDVVITHDPITKGVVKVRATALPTVNWPFMIVYNTSDGHVYERKSDDSGWTDLGAVDSVGNTATVAEVLAGTDASKFVTPDALAGLWKAGTAVTLSANNISLPSTGGGVFTCGTATGTLTTISSATEGREVEIIFTNVQTITHGSGINVLGALTTKIPAGTRVRFRRNASDWTVLWWLTVRGPFLGTRGATGRTVTNSGNTTILATANSAVLESTVGWCVKHLTVSVSINLATTGANALDTGTQSTGFYHVWLISDGTTVAGLASTSSTAPTMPSGYTYKLRIGAMYSVAAVLRSTTQKNDRTQVINATQLPVMASGNVGVAPTTAVAVAAFVPTTATEIQMVLNQVTSNTSAQVAPNANYTTMTNANGGFTGWADGTVSKQIALYVSMVLESTNVYWGSNGAGNNLLCAGWIDPIS